MDRVCKSIDSVKIKTAIKPVKTLISTGSRTRSPMRMVYNAPCEDCEHSHMYVGETRRTLKKRIGEHKAAVKKEDKRNGIAVHVKNISNETQYLRKGVVEAISIQTRP